MGAVIASGARERYEEGVRRRVYNMQKFFAWVGAIIVSSLGWWLGSQIGIMTAVIFSGIGTGVGFYFGKKLAREWL